MGIFYSAAAVFGFLLLCGTCVAGAEDARTVEDQKAAELILKLGAADFETRSKAEESLSSMGEKAIPELKKNENSKDPEIRMRVLRILSRLNTNTLQGLFSRKAALKGFGDDPARSKVWPCIMEVKEFNEKTGDFKGRIEWTNLDALNEIEGKLAVDNLVFKEVRHIRRGNSIIGCVYTFDFKDDVNRKGRKIRGKWTDPSTGNGGNIELALE